MKSIANKVSDMENKVADTEFKNQRALKRNGLSDSDNE